jgi:hypothetical protein
MKKHTEEDKTKGNAEDAFEEWFEATDLGALVPKAQAAGIDGLGSRARGRPRIGRKISLILPEETIQELSKRAEKRGMGYQTYARMVLMNLGEDEAV